MRRVTTYIGILLMALFLIVVSYWNYLLFHSLTEVFSIVIAASIFVISHNTLGVRSNSSMDILGIGYLAVALLDTLHTLSYTGMGVFTDYDYYTNQIWIGTRYLESLVLLTSVGVMIQKKKLSQIAIWSVISIATAALLYSILIGKNFPVCFIEGEGLTPFKVVSEYIIIAVLSVTLFVSYRFKSHFPEEIHRPFTMAIVWTILAELAFTFYISNYGFSNMAGHLAKVVSFYFIYKGIIQSSLKTPYATLFQELIAKNEALEETLANVRTLQGLIPVCAWCHKIREDSGYWESVESYLSHLEGTAVTHGICPECAAKLERDMDDESEKNHT